jgi:hypothetical protein
MRLLGRPRHRWENDIAVDTTKNKLTLSLFNQPRARWDEPQLIHQGWDNVLSGQGYRTPQGAFIDECRAMLR